MLDYAACIYDAANFVLEGRTDGPTDKAILGVGLAKSSISKLTGDFSKNYQLRKNYLSPNPMYPPPAGGKWQTKYNSDQSVWRLHRRKNIPKNNDW